MKSLANEFFSTMAEGARKHQAAHAAEYDLIVNGIKNETDLAEQVNLVEQMIARRVNAIVIAPADSKALVTVLKRAKEAGILVVNIDNKLDSGVLQEAGLSIPFVGPDNREGARKVGEVLAVHLNKGDKVAIIEGIPTAFNGQQRRLGFEDAMKAAAMDIVGAQSGEWEMDKANNVAAAMLSEHPDLKAILCANDNMALGAVAAIQAAGKTGKVLVVGFDNIAAIHPMLADGRVVATADQHADQLAVFGIQAALSILKGEAPPADQHNRGGPRNQVAKVDSPNVPLLRVQALHKSYNVPVLTDFSFELDQGEVHALIGSNGAGKSTFARILCGLTPPNRGNIQLAGQTYLPASKRHAEHAGVVMVLQELNVIGTLTVAENIFLSRLPRRAGFVRFTELNQMAREALERVGLGDLDPATPAGQLGVGQQQLVEIAGALALNCRVLILDEPTAALTDPEIKRLFENIRKLQSQGVGIIYISHRMDEIRRISTRVTVLRDGRRVATHPAQEVTPPQLVREMVGHDLPERKSAGTVAAGNVALRVCNLSAGSRVRDVSFDLRYGEILGLAGLIGSGRTETLRAIFGADPKDGGEVHLGDSTQPLHIGRPADAVRYGIGMVPEDRKQDGLLLAQSIRVNTTLATLRRHATGLGWLNTKAETDTTQTFCRRLALRCASPEQTVAELSGGNQQKVVIARWLARGSQVLLFDEPTRGIDVAAKDMIYQLLRDLASEGKAVLMVSSELTELMALCDRILVMSAGHVAAEFLPGQWTQEKITEAAFSGYLDRARA